MKQELIAPCGMNCALCVNYQARENDLNKQGFKKTYCEGCIPRGQHCLHMGDSCEMLKNGQVRFCYECDNFPCKRLKALDKRYRTKYHMSMIDNLSAIEKSGIESFLENESAKWACLDCGGTICCHNGLCLGCHADILRENKKYHWGV